MLINFVKMHSLGNDFVIIDLITQNAKLHTAHIKKIANRHLGVGCDQILLIEPPFSPDVDFNYKIFNSNGHEAEQCGNGVRCAAKLFYDAGLTESMRLIASCSAGRIALEIKDSCQVSANMGKAILKSPFIPYQISIKNHSYDVYLVSMGNPHGIVFVKNLSNLPIEELGSQLSSSEYFPKGCNISFAQIDNNSNITARVFERGTGLTNACGSGACAISATSLALRKTTATTINIHFNYGTLHIKQQPNGDLILNGPVNSVFNGQFRI